MCEHCEHCKPILENENSVVFISAGRLILQDKTKPMVQKCDPLESDDHAGVWYDSKWITIHACPVCGKELY